MEPQPEHNLPKQYRSNLRNVRGTLAAEGMSLSHSTEINLIRIASGIASYQDIIKELRGKYAKRG